MNDGTAVRVTETSLPGVMMVQTRVLGDSRGYFRETWRMREYADAGLPERFVQDNVSCSKRGVLRGLHLQEPHGQGKLVSAVYGEIWDVAVDVRQDSEHFGRWVGVHLSGSNGVQLYIPPGFAHGLLVTSAEAVVVYKCTEVYHPGAEHTLLWDDPDLAIEWPDPAPILSDKDRAGQRLRDFRPGRVPGAGR